MRPLSVVACSNAARIVQETHGLIGAEALRHSVAGLTRRAATEIKSDTCRAMERQRRERAERVTVAAPGILRGFDAMDLGHRGRAHSYALIAADGCVPFRTSWSVAERYDGREVAAVLSSDFDRFGAPLVLRLDRAACHEVPAVREVLAANHVLALHGPAHYARYYGQLERQNREHREWLVASRGTLDIDKMMVALNERCRSTLDWRSAQELWRERPRLEVDRQAFAEDVAAREARLRPKLHGPAAVSGLAWRVAVKQALLMRGLLRVEKGGWC